MYCGNTPSDFILNRWPKTKIKTIDKSRRQYSNVLGITNIERMQFSLKISGLILVLYQTKVNLGLSNRLKLNFTAGLPNTDSSVN